MADLTIDIINGYNDNDAPTAVPKDQCVEAENVEFVRSQIGERRAGAETVTIAGSGLESHTHMSWLFRHTPSALESAAQLWAFSVTPGVSSQLSYKDTSWHSVSPTDAIGIAGLQGFQLSGQSLHLKLFIAYKSTVDRLHVWDGTTLRRVGLAMPTAAPTSANTGSGSYAGTRYHRVRYTVQVAGVTVLRSEPSAVLTSVPSGSGTGLILTKPVTIGENETHWELEASVNNGDFYRIATTVVGTTTVTDSVAFSTGYAVAGVLSDDIGDYTVPGSARYVSADNDRILTAGSWETPLYGSRVSWTPVGGDLTGVGNDERIPLDTNNFLDLDTTEGGDITGMSSAVNGYVYVTKGSHIYRLVRSGIRLSAYEAFSISKQVGAIEGSLVDGIDQNGNPCLYGLDARVGPWRIGAEGLQMCGQDIAGDPDATWGRVNVDATTVVARGGYYQHLRQVKYWVAVDGGNTPGLQLVLQTDRTQVSADGVRKGWSTATGAVAQALSVCMFAGNVNDGVARSLVLRPLIGLGGTVASILRLDTGTTDAGTIYRAHLKTRPYMLAGLLNRFGAMAGGILATAASGVTVFVRAIRDFGVEESTNTHADLSPTNGEDQVIRALDDLNISDLRALQLEYGDLDEDDTPNGTWEINMIALKPRPEETA